MFRASNLHFSIGFFGGDPESGSTMFAPTVTMDKIPSPKDCQVVKKPLVIFRVSPIFLGVVSSDDKANPVSPKGMILIPTSSDFRLCGDFF